MYFWNQDISDLSIFKFGMPPDTTNMEGDMSQNFYLGFSF